jgi:glyoxylase-like metal-dependent hydrolase (beta-lactamase superfamily II)
VTLRLQIESFYDRATYTFSHLLWDRVTAQCAIIDSVLDFDPHAGRTYTTSADGLIGRVRELGLTLEWLLETHVHADHLSAASYIKQVLGGRIAISANITVVQKVFGKLFNAGPDFACDGSQFCRLLEDGEVVMVGALPLIAMHTPGHTPACMTLLVSDTTVSPHRHAAFVGDTIFMPDFGTARCDFPGGNARTLFQSVQKILALPEDTELYLCHDYPPSDREPVCMVHVAEQKRSNLHVRTGTGESEFVQLREQRDASLDMPVLLLPAVQVNMRAGQFPAPEGNGTVYLKIPINAI